MSAQHQLRTAYTLDEYLAFENGSDSRHEYYRGEITAILSSGFRHSDVLMNVLVALHRQLRGRPYKSLGINQRLRVDAADLTTSPDILVVCPPFSMSSRDSIALTDATVLIEILSPSIAHYDQTAKFDFYCYLDSFRHYVLVEADEIGVEHRFKTDSGDWEIEQFTDLNDEIALQTIDCRLRVAEIYEDIEF